MALPLLVSDPWDDLDDTERAELYSALAESIAQADAGQLIDADVVLAELNLRHRLNR